MWLILRNWAGSAAPNPLQWGVKTHVDAEDSRPAGKPDECFYCLRKVGEEHTWECVIPTKRIRVRTTLEYEVEAPRSWENEFIEFHLAEKGCLFNIARDIRLYSDRLDAVHPNECVEDHPSFKVLGPGKPDESPLQ